LKKNVEKFCENIVDWDVLVIGGNIVPPYQQIGDYCVRVFNNQTLTGYIVRQHYYDKLISNFREGLKLLISNPENKREYAIDMYWKRLQKTDLYFFITPPTVTQREGFSDIEKIYTDYRGLMLDMNKEWLFQHQMPSIMPSTIPSTVPTQTNTNIELGVKHRPTGSLQFN
jgi:hypothetical protein